MMMNRRGLIASLGAVCTLPFLPKLAGANHNHIKIHYINIGNYDRVLATLKDGETIYVPLSSWGATSVDEFLDFYKKVTPDLYKDARYFYMFKGRGRNGNITGFLMTKIAVVKAVPTPRILLKGGVEPKKIFKNVRHS
jgi:hypothetical protein